MNRLPQNWYRASTYAAIDPNSIVPNVLNATMTTLLNMYVPICALDQARPNASKLKWLGSVQASPKISGLVLNAAMNVQISGAITSSAQTASATWPRLARTLTWRRSDRAGAACEAGRGAEGVVADTSSVWMVVMVDPQNSMRSRRVMRMVRAANASVKKNNATPMAEAYPARE